MNKLFLLYTLVIVTGLTLIAGCQSDDQKIREIVKEELRKSMERSAVTDVNVIGPYIPAQKVGNFLFTSGQIAINQETGQLDDGEVGRRHFEAGPSGPGTVSFQSAARRATVDCASPSRSGLNSCRPRRSASSTAARSQRSTSARILSSRVISAPTVPPDRL